MKAYVRHFIPQLIFKCTINFCCQRSLNQNDGGKKKRKKGKRTCSLKLPETEEISFKNSTRTVKLISFHLGPNNYLLYPI